MKRLLYGMFLFLLVLLLAGCAGEQITLHQPEGEIEQIELVFRSFEVEEVLYSLSDEEISSFLDALSDLRLRKNWSPQDIGGTLMIRIVYVDQKIDLLGSASVGYGSGDTWEHDGWYYLRQEELNKLFSKYCDLSDLPGI